MQPRISMLALGVADLPRALRFYRDGLGWTPQPSSNAQLVLFPLAGDLTLALYPQAPLAEVLGVPAEYCAPGQFSGLALAHNVQHQHEVEGILQQALAAGARLLRPASTTDWGAWAGCFADPDGHVWEIVFNPRRLPQ